MLWPEKRWEPGVISALYNSIMGIRVYVFYSTLRLVVNIKSKFHIGGRKVHSSVLSMLVLEKWLQVRPSDKSGC
jgi:hypothetical protein